MERICQREASCWLASVSSLAKRTLGSRSRAACSKVGAKLRHGPHQEAQQSTTTGISVWLSIEAALEAVRVMGLPLNNGFLHLPHLGPSPSRSLGTRLDFRQWGQLSVVVLMVLNMGAICPIPTLLMTRAEVLVCAPVHRPDLIDLPHEFKESMANRIVWVSNFHSLSLI